MLDTSRPIVARPEYSIVLSAHRQMGAVRKMSTKFCQRNGCGQSSGDSVWLLVINAVSVMKTNGARNSAATTTSRLLFATASSRRRRRAAHGGFRRANGL